MDPIIKSVLEEKELHLYLRGREFILRKTGDEKTPMWTLWESGDVHRFVAEDMLKDENESLTDIISAVIRETKTKPTKDDDLRIDIKVIG